MPQWLHANATLSLSLGWSEWRYPVMEDSSGLNTQSSGNYFSQELDKTHNIYSDTQRAMRDQNGSYNIQYHQHYNGNPYMFICNKSYITPLNIVTGMIWMRQAMVYSSASVSHAARGTHRGNTLSVIMTTWKGKNLKSCLLQLTSKMAHISDSLLTIKMAA